jgi:hypothetical protein
MGADFAAPRQAAALIESFERSWCIAGGWAIDLFLGRVRQWLVQALAIAAPDHPWLAKLQYIAGLTRLLAQRVVWRAADPPRSLFFWLVSPLKWPTPATRKKGILGGEASSSSTT